MAYTDYDFYINKYYGDQIDEEDFQKFAERASDYVYSYTQGLSNNVASTKTIEQVRKATCAIAEILQDENTVSQKAYSSSPMISSESVGSYSRSFEKAEMGEEDIQIFEKRKMDALRLYLGNLSEFAKIFRVRSYPCTHRTQ